MVLSKNFFVYIRAHNQDSLRSTEAKYQFAQPGKYQVYTAVAEQERKLLSGHLQSDESDDEDTPFLDAGIFAMLPEILGKGVYHAPQNEDTSVFGLTDIDGSEETLPTPASWLDDNTISMVEAIIILLRQLWRVRDGEDFAIACIQFVKAVTGKSAISTLFSVISKAKDMVCGLVTLCAGRIQGEETNNPFTHFRKVLQRVIGGMEHPLLDKMKQILWYLLSYALLERAGITFDTFWYSEAEKETLQRQHTSPMGFVKAVFDGLLSIFERLVDCYQTKSWSPLLANEKSFGDWTDSVFDLKAKSTLLHNPKANGFTYPQFLGELESAIEKGRALLKYQVDKSTAAGLKRMLGDLEMIKAMECTKKAARKSRNAPFAILYNAGSSVGKSTLQDLTHTHFAKTHGLPDGAEYKYARTYSDEYWSGFMSQMWSIIMDDIAAYNPDKCSSVDPSMSEILQIRNNAPFCPPQAELADKGKTPVLCELLQGSTNTKHLNAAAFYNNPLAIMRRFNFIVTVTLKAEYATLVNGQVPEPDERMLDSSRVPPLEDGEYDDLWEFLVEKVVAKHEHVTKKQYAVYEPVLITDCIYEFLAFISKESTAFRLQQAKIQESAAKSARAVLCTECYRPSVKCVCAGETQSKEALALSMTLAGCAAFAAPKLKNMAVSALERRAVDSTVKVAKGVATKFKEEGIEYLDQWLEQNRSGPRERATEFLPAPQGPTDTQPNILPDFPEPPQKTWYEEIEFVAGQRYECATERLQFAKSLARRKVKGIVRTIRMYNNNGDGNSPMGNIYRSVIMLVAMVATMKLLTKVFFPTPKKKKSGKTQNSWEEGVENLPKETEENPWYRDEYVPNELELGPLVSSWKSLPREQVIHRIQRNVKHFSTKYERDGKEYMRQFRAVCIEGQLFVTNSHNVPECRQIFTITSREVCEGVNSQITTYMNVADLFRDSDNDLVFFVIRCMPPAASLSGLLVTSSFKTVCSGEIISRNQNGIASTSSVSALHKDTFFSEEIGTVPVYKGECDRMTVSGECGSPYVGFAPVGPVLLGVHVMGGISHTVACTMVTQESVDCAKRHFGYRSVVAGTPNLTNVDGSPIELQPIHKKSVFRYIQQGTAEVYGSLPGFRTAPKSKVSKTLVHEQMKELGYQVKVGAPVMRSYMPWRLGTLDIVQQESKVDCSILDNCVESFSQDILGKLTKEDLSEMVILGNAPTLNGLPGVKYIDKMNRNTSMGFPWRHSKKRELILYGAHEEWPDYVEFSPDFYDRVDTIVENYRKGVRNMPVFTTHLKDEVLNLKKVAEKKTRLFTGCPADFAFVMRKYLLATVRVIQKNRFVFECAPGTNATSIEWDGIYHYLVQHGRDRIIAGDYSKFDKRMSAILILAAFKVIVNILAAAGWNDEDLHIVWTMAFDIAFPVADHNGDFVQFLGSNPSGHPLTVIINSIVNSLYVRYAWCTSNHNLEDFVKYVALMTYGDDNIMGVSRDVRGFDHTVMQTELAKIGVVYTMADKEAESVPFMDISEVSFLKRSWVFSPEVGSHIAKLEHDSIEKGLLYHIPSKVVCPEQQSVDVMMNALREYFFYGREIFEERREKFLAVIVKCGLVPYLTEVPAYDTLVEQYLASSAKYAPGGRCEKCSA